MPNSTAESYVIPLIRRIVAECPRRVAGSASEKRAHDILRAELESRGVHVEYTPVTWNRSLYATMALHFGVAVLGTALLLMGLPLVALPLHLIAALSYVGDSSKRWLWLRRLQPSVQSQNLVATLPAEGTPALRIVLVAHIDAAYTGLIFDPWMIRNATRAIPIPGLRWLQKQMLVATGSVFLLATLDVAALFWGLPAGLIIGVGIPSFLACALNLDVVIRNQVVPGANDNLTGSVASVVVADRLGAIKPTDVELVLVATGCEEAGTGGAYNLAQQKAAEWSVDNTVVLGIDTLTGGEIRLLMDGEVLPQHHAPWLLEAIETVAASRPEYAQVQRFDIPAGATDTNPFLTAGYVGVGIGCVDPYIGAPRNYHHPSDTPDNLDAAQLDLTLDFVCDVTAALMKADSPARGRT